MATLCIDTFASLKYCENESKAGSSDQGPDSDLGKFPSPFEQLPKSLTAFLKVLL